MKRVAVVLLSLAVTATAINNRYVGASGGSWFASDAAQEQCELKWPYVPHQCMAKNRWSAQTYPAWPEHVLIDKPVDLSRRARAAALMLVIDAGGDVIVGANGDLEIGPTTCDATQTQLAPASNVADTDCRDNVVCDALQQQHGAAEYETSPRTPTVDRTCAPLDLCDPRNEFEAVAPTPTSNRECQVHRKCTPDEYETRTPTRLRDRRCKELTKCEGDQWETLAATLTSDRACASHTTCLEDQWQSKTPGTHHDRECSAITTCDAREWEEAAFTATSDRVCTPHTVCKPTPPASRFGTAVGEFMTKAAGTHHDRECAALTICTDAEYELVAPTATSDRECARKECQCVCRNSLGKLDWCDQRFHASGAKCPKHRGDMCTSCPAGYHEEDGGSLCSANACTCKNGTERAGVACSAHGEEQCSSCAEGYQLVNSKCTLDCDKPCGKSPSGKQERRIGCDAAKNQPGRCTTVDDPVEFGLDDLQEAPKKGTGFMLADARVLNYYRSQFAAQYNSQGGLPAIRRFKAGNCCIALKYGLKLTISNTKYGFAFPSSSTSGKINCNPKGGYGDPYYKFFLVPRLDATHVLGEKKACQTNHNPAVFWRPKPRERTPTITPVRTEPEFGLYTLSAVPAGGWTAMSLSDLTTHRANFIKYYNKKGGLYAVERFQSKNCCIALRGGDKLTIVGSKYGIVFPADPGTKKIQCNPKGGYGYTTSSTRPNVAYSFYLAPAQLPANTAFGSKKACVTNENPTLYMRTPTWHTNVEFGMYDAEKAPVGGWELMAAADFTRFRAAFVQEYNANGGIKTIATFQSKNCCIAVKGPHGSKLIVSDTPYNFQFPAAPNGGIRCNPTGGYSGRYQFYRKPALTLKTEFSAKVACATNHNPAIYFRGATPPTPLPSPAPTPKPTPAPIDCKLTAWSAWTACSKTCGRGLEHRQRHVSTEARHGGVSCHPQLKETRVCHEQDCPVHCEMSEFSEWTACPRCGEGTQTRKRIVMVAGNANGADGVEGTADDVPGAMRCPHEQETKTCKLKECEIDCVIGMWGGWSKCARSCGGAVQRRTRPERITAKFDGQPCAEHKEETRTCNGSPCPTDCVLRGWSGWSACTATCGGGERMRERTVVREASHGGISCAPFPLKQVDKSCGDGACPIDCAFSQWSAWSDCSTTCGNGIRARSRSVARSAAHGGKVCSMLADRMQEKDCMLGHCPIHCEAGPFSRWEQCSHSCGGGTQARRRNVHVFPQFEGAKACPALRETRSCNDHACPVDCELMPWGAWSACSQTCGSGGERRRSRAVDPDRAGAHGGKVCDPERVQVEKGCAQKIRQFCPVDCEVTEWSTWTACSLTCEEGVSTRQRVVTTRPAHDGRTCPELSQRRTCNNGPCPRHCVVSHWYEWSECSTTCGVGVHMRLREVQQHAENGGYVCPHLRETRECKNRECPLDCLVTAWTNWSSCSASCGLGEVTRTRSVMRKPRYHGAKPCPVDMEERRPCTATQCPVDCVLEAWSSWSACDKTCGTGKQSRTRTELVLAAHGGEPCESGRVQTQECVTVDYCPQDCEMSAWSSWTGCSTTCGTGSKRRTRSVVKHPKYRGKACPEERYQFEACNTRRCPVDCVMGPFGNWGECSTKCGGGTQERVRDQQVQPTPDGKPCGAGAETRSCNDKPCPRDCVLSQWSTFSTCSAKCGVGRKTRTRSVVTRTAYGGKGCVPDMTQIFTCDAGPCPVHCEVTPWLSWGSCSVKCGGGRQSRTRKIKTHAEHGGYTCPLLEESRACGEAPCPKPCVVGAWGAWQTRCPSCLREGDEQMQRKRTRKVTRPAEAGGECLQPLEDYQRCAVQKMCAEHCKMSQWGAFSTCSKSCTPGGESPGVARRTRHIISRPKHGGDACQGLTQTAACNTHSCPVDCVMTAWGAWSFCSKSCGGGTHYRTRTVETPDQHGGASCPPQQENAKCNDFTCPDPSQSPMSILHLIPHSKISTKDYSTNHWDNNGKFIAPVTVRYYPEMAKQCCNVECAKKQTDASRKDCRVGCNLWLHHSSLNWESIRWRPLLLQKCQKDCSSARLWDQNMQSHIPSGYDSRVLRARAGQGRVWHERQSLPMELSGQGMRPAEEGLCKAGCRQYYDCSFVTPLTSTTSAP